MGLHRQVVEGLGRRIGQGDLRPGDVVDITEVQGRYGASRTAVREAIKVLSAKGLIAARPRYGTYVRPRGEWNAFDADVLQWQDGSASSLRLLRNLDEVRRIVEPQAARVAAGRRRRAELGTMHTALQDLERAPVCPGGDAQRPARTAGGGAATRAPVAGPRGLPVASRRSGVDGAAPGGLHGGRREGSGCR